MKKAQDTRVKLGTTNVFADLDFPEAETQVLQSSPMTHDARLCARAFRGHSLDR